MKKNTKLNLLILLLLTILITSLILGRKRETTLLASNLEDYKTWNNEHNDTYEVNASDKDDLDMFYKKANNKLNVSTLILGDDLTIGNTNSSDLSTFDKSFSSMLKTQYTITSTYKYLQESHATTTRINELLDADSSITNFDLAIISLGESDFDNNISIDEFSQKYTNIICKLKSKNYKCSIIALIPPCLNSDTTYNASIKSICKSNNINCVDIASSFNNSGYELTDLLTDKIPTPLGYRIINLAINNFIIKNN